MQLWRYTGAMSPVRPGPWSKMRSRSAGTFGVLVAAVFAVAFATTLAWPVLTDRPGPTLEAIEPAARETGSRPTEPSARSGGSPTEVFLCPVAAVTDGDSLRCRDGTRVRLHAIAARERDGGCSLGHPCPAASAEQAALALQRLATGATLQCERTGSSFDRVTAICWTATGVEVNCALVRQGVVALWDRYDRQRRLCRS